LIVHNAYGKPSGEEVVVESVSRMLTDRGHHAELFACSSAEIESMCLGKSRAFISGIANPRARRSFRDFIHVTRPDVVNIHNLYPLLSPSILPECTASSVTTLMTVHNFRLICPNGLFLSHGEICEKCGGGREYWCVLRNCEGHLIKSIGYALRNAVARKFKMYMKNVQVFACLTRFQRRKLIEAGFPEERVVVIPNALDSGLEEAHLSPGEGEYVGFVGRICHEKGIDTLLAAARRRPDIPFQIAGHASEEDPITANPPQNVTFRGHLNSEGLRNFYLHARFIIMQSRWYEGFPMVLLEAMKYGKPAIGPRLGGIPEIIMEGKTGLLFEAGNIEEYVACIDRLWDSPETCAVMGAGAQARLKSEYSADRYYQRFMAAVELAKKFRHGNDSYN